MQRKSHHVTCVAAGEKYIARADHAGEHDGDIPFPKGATVDVLEKNNSGWWTIRYDSHNG